MTPRTKNTALQAVPARERGGVIMNECCWVAERSGTAGSHTHNVLCRAATGACVAWVGFRAFGRSKRFSRRFRHRRPQNENQSPSQAVGHYTRSTAVLGVQLSLVRNSCAGVPYCMRHWNTVTRTNSFHLSKGVYGTWSLSWTTTTAVFTTAVLDFVFQKQVNRTHFSSRRRTLCSL